LRSLHLMPSQWPPPSALPDEADEPVTDAGERWGWIELFIGIQLLWGVLLFVPGMQPYRAYIRALPYLASLGALAVFLPRILGESLAASGRWLVAVFALLFLNLLHSETHLMAGVAQIVFQLAIAAPMFWGMRAVQSEARLLRLIWVIFWASFVSAATGVLQVYFPEQFLPPEFSALARSLNPDYVEALTYVGANRELIVRPPGLSDLPGGAAISGLMTVVLGVALAVHGHPTRMIRALSFGAAAIGMTALYLTQVRSLTVMAVLSIVTLAAVRLRQGRVLQGSWIVVGAVVLVAGSFAWAVALGGESLADRFWGLIETGVLTSFQENRGLFLEYTLRELLFQFPLGAGLGRWGMMHVYFGDPAMWQSPPIHVEIQITGWLLDGGVPMWLFYGGALVSAVRFSYALATRGVTESLQYFATVALAIQLTIIGLCFTGPAFNTQLGILFWTVTAALLGAAEVWPGREDAEVVSHEDEASLRDDDAIELEVGV
jgi:hypothetical protein